VKKTILNPLLFALLLLGFHSNLMAQQGQSPYDPTKSLDCMITTDFYIVHLTSYQQPKPDGKKRHTFKPFCKELPEHGPSHLALDFIDRDLRKMPIGMEVIELLDNPDGEEMLDGKSIALITPQTYKTGVAQIQADFPKPGHYALIATVGDDMFADKIRIPLRVGIGSAFSIAFLYPYLFFIFVALIAYGIYRFFIYRFIRNKVKEYEAEIELEKAEDED